MNDDDIPADEKIYPLRASKMSKTPSWVMLGFVLGAMFVWVFFRRAPEPALVAATPPASAQAAEPEPVRAPGPLSRIEAMWEDWGKYAIWSDEIAEVGLWDTTLERFADFYEVRRIEGKYFFRTIPRLTRLVVTRYKIPEGCPLQFTETAEQYREWFDSIPPVQRMWKPPPPKTAPVTAPAIPEGAKTTPGALATPPPTVSKSYALPDSAPPGKK